MPAKDPYSHYKETQIMTASQGKLIVLLYEGAIKFIDTAVRGLDEKKYDTVNNNLVRAQDIVTELALSLDFNAGGELASKLYNLYMYFNKRLLEGNVSKDKDPLLEVRSLLTGLLDSWRQIADKAPDTSSSSSGVNIAG